VELAVIEAGLGGRFDATNVIDANVCVLTNVGLEHTRWLGPTVRDIAAEKLAVVPANSTLLLGAGVQPEVLELARSVAARRQARLVTLRATDTVAPAARGPFQRRNFALARAAAESYLTASGGSVSAQAVRAAAASVRVPGRFEVVRSSPLTVFDGAHNPDAAVALSEALAGTDQPLGLVFGVLEDKDAVGMLRTLLPRCERAWFTAPPSPRALPPATLQSLAGQLGFHHASCEPQPYRALQAASEWAERSLGTDRTRPRAAQRGGLPRMVLATGSVYLVGELLRELRDSPAELRAS
jgi:dihydrofolate synthase/folylpolyglutamate synthase